MQETDSIPYVRDDSMWMQLVLCESLLVGYSYSCKSN